MLRNSFIVLLAFFITNCDPISSTDSEVVDALIIKKEQIADLRELEATFTVKNSTSGVQQFGFSSGCQVGYKIKEGDAVIFDSRQFFLCTQALTSFKLDPGEVKQFLISFKYLADDLKELPELEGKYSLSAFLLNKQKHEASAEFIIE